MSITENIRLALEGLRSNKMRALLTMLGIIIGIASVIAIVTLGDSMTASVSTSMQSFGATNIMVNVQERDSQGNPMGSGSSITENDMITDEMIESYLEIYGGQIDAVSISSSGGSGRAQEGSLYANVSVTGVNDGYAPANNVIMVSGRFIRDGDMKAKRYVAVVSDKFAENMFPKNPDPLGEEIKVTMGTDMQTYTIVGIYKYEQSAMTMMMNSSVSDKDIRTNMYIPISTCNVVTSGVEGYQSLTVMASADADSAGLARSTRQFFNTYYVNNPRYSVSAMSMESMMDTVSTMMGTISVAIAVIAGISLLVGGIGVMNIMLVSVTERTREIGTRKALGARNSAIRIQFIIEAIIICCIGGLIGVAIGFIGGYAGSSALGYATTPSVTIITIAVLFSMAIGVFFGYYPANKAARLDPIEALRYE